jgi:hypothetical protein
MKNVGVVFWFRERDIAAEGLYVRIIWNCATASIENDQRYGYQAMDRWPDSVRNPRDLKDSLPETLCFHWVEL